MLTTTPWPRPTPAGVATARGGESPRACNGAQREWKAPWSAQTERSAVRKTGETPCGRGRAEPLVRVFAVAVVFVVVFAGAGFELAGPGSVLNPRRPESAPRGGAASRPETPAALRNLPTGYPTRKFMSACRAKSRLTAGRSRRRAQKLGRIARKIQDDVWSVARGSETD